MKILINTEMKTLEAENEKLLTQVNNLKEDLMTGQFYVISIELKLKNYYFLKQNFSVTTFNSFCLKCLL